MSELILECTTELEAVNSILATVGESPVDTLTEAFVDAGLAQSLLKQESRRAQLAGWSFNTDNNVTLQPSMTGEIALPRNILRVVTSPNYVQRGYRLYDSSRQSYIFEEPITGVTLVTALTFEELPEAARQFITIRAGRRFQNQYQGDNTLHEIHARDELAAWAAFLNYEAETAQHNMLDNSVLNVRMKMHRPGASVTRSAGGFDR